MEASSTSPFPSQLLVIHQDHHTLSKEVVSIKADLSGPVHPPKPAGEQFINTFTCDTLRGNGNEEYSLTSNKGKAYTDMDSDSKTEITSKFNGKLVAMQVKVDPGSEANCIPFSHFRHLFSQLCREDSNPRKNPWNQLWHSLRHMIVEYYRPTDDQSCYSNLVEPHEGPSVSKKTKKPSDSNNNNFLSGPQHPPKGKYFLTAPQHPPKEKYSQMVTATR